MTVKMSPQELAAAYYQRIQRLRGREDIPPPWPGLTSLRNFVENPHPCVLPSDISIINIPGDGSSETEISLKNLRGPHDLLENIPSMGGESEDSQLIVVENICPRTLTILGGHYNIDPQFFAEFGNVLSWYQMYEAVPERLPSLPSTKKAEDFLILRYVSPRELDENDSASISGESVIWPNMRFTRSGHTAGRLEPIPGPRKTFPPMLFTRQTFGVWCKKKPNGSGWIAIILLDGPFQLYEKYGSLGQAEFRNPNLRPKADEQLHHDETRQSFKKAFCSFLQQRCKSDDTYRRMCATNIFLTLYEGYRIIASEWLVVNEYVKRELANIERHLEKKESTFQELEQHLKSLYRVRRRCNKEHELVTEAITQCANRGQTLWPSSMKVCSPDANAISFSERHANEIEEDFKYVLNNMSINLSRIEKDIDHLMALVSISEGRQSLQENRGISFLTLVAMIFLPSQTVASVLGIQTQYGPGARDFWILWAVALPVTMLVTIAASLYPVVSASWSYLYTRYFQSREKPRRGSASGLQNEGYEFSPHPALLMHQKLVGTVV